MGSSNLIVSYKCVGRSLVYHTNRRFVTPRIDAEYRSFKGTTLARAALCVHPNNTDAQTSYLLLGSRGFYPETFGNPQRPRVVQWGASELCGVEFPKHPSCILWATSYEVKLRPVGWKGYTEPRRVQHCIPSVKQIYPGLLILRIRVALFTIGLMRCPSSVERLSGARRETQECYDPNFAFPV